MSVNAKPYDQVEARIRNYLAEHLDLIESGLSLIKMEYRIKEGPRILAKIDLFARDESGCLVIIEIKRSKEAMRQATQEIQQYAELLRQKHGVGPDMVRGIIVSTDWSQALPAFSSMVRHGSYHVDGYELHLRNEIPCAVMKVVPLKATRPLTVAREHGVYLFSSADSRDRALSVISENADSAGFDDRVVMLLHYSGTSDAVVFKYACYLVPGVIDEAVCALMAQKLAVRYGMLPSEVSETLVMRGLLAGIGTYLRAAQCPEYCGYEDGSPHVIATMLTNWNVDTISRSGRFAASDADIFSDHKLMRMAAQIEGSNPVGFSWRGKPRLLPMWEKMKDSLHGFLLHNDIWLNALDWFLDKVAQEHADDFVSIEIRDPRQTLIGINKMAVHDDDSLLPTMLAAVETKGVFSPCVAGTVRWDGQTFPTLSDVLRGRGRLRDRVFWYLTNNAASATFANEVLARHGMAYDVVLVETRADGTESAHQLRADSPGSVHLVPTVIENHRTIVDFCQSPQNGPYLVQLREHLSVIVEM